MLRLPEYKLRALLDQTRMGPTARRACRHVICDGMGVRDTARLLDVSPQVVSRATTRIQRLYKRIFRVPLDWRMVTVTLPPEHAEHVREIERAAWREYGLGPPP